jgi:hypothetical protein
MCRKAGIYDDGMISVTSIVSRDAMRHGPGQGLCELEYDFVGQAGETRAPWHCEDREPPDTLRGSQGRH